MKQTIEVFECVYLKKKKLVIYINKYKTLVSIDFFLFNWNIFNCKIITDNYIVSKKKTIP